MPRERRPQVPAVRPPREASGGGEGPDYGTSGAPGQPPLGRGKRARDEIRERAAMARGRFSERIFRFPDFLPILPQTTSDDNPIEAKSNGDSFLRFVAMRGGLKATTAALNGLELANMRLQLSIDGLEDLCTSGKTALPAEFDGLFSNTSAPWFWFAAPPLVRVGSTISANVTNDFAAGEGAPHLTPYLMLRLVDDCVWWDLYGS